MWFHFQLAPLLPHEFNGNRKLSDVWRVPPQHGGFLAGVYAFVLSDFLNPGRNLR
jgi:hypothetical protein